jgi:heme exporter protein A
MADSAPSLSTVALVGQRGDRVLFRGLTMTLAPGQIVWLRGRNGRGKTSLLRILAGLSAPAEGELFCAGQLRSGLTAEWRERLIYIGHASALKDDLTVAECLRFAAAVQGRQPSPNEIDAALATWGMLPLRHAPVRRLSQGQRRRTALARLALPQPLSIWLLDEPLDALDDEGVQTLCTLLAGQAARGGSVMLTSHQALPLTDPLPSTLDLDALEAQGRTP